MYLVLNPALRADRSRLFLKRERRKLNAAKRAQLERGDAGPLLPADLLEARETLAKEGRGSQLRPPPPRVGGFGDGGGGGGGYDGGGRSLIAGSGVLTKGNPI